MDGSTTHMSRVGQQEVGRQHAGMDGGSTTHIHRVRQQEVGRQHSGMDGSTTHTNRVRQ